MISNAHHHDDCRLRHHVDLGAVYHCTCPEGWPKRPEEMGGGVTPSTAADSITREEACRAGGRVGWRPLPDEGDGPLYQDGLPRFLDNDTDALALLEARRKQVSSLATYHVRRFPDGGEAGPWEVVMHHGHRPGVSTGSGARLIDAAVRCVNRGES